MHAASEEIVVLIRPFGPRRGPGLLRAAARTAVVAGTATAVTGAVRRHQAADYPPPVQGAPAPAVAPPRDGPPQYAPPTPGAGGAGVTDDQLDRLERLARLADQGVLTPEEVQKEKDAILGL